MRLSGDYRFNIEHIHSTAIANVPAKDSIDLQVGVKDFSTIDIVKGKLSEIGENHLFV